MMPLKKVVKHEERRNGQHRKLRIFLECGHSQRRKGSDGVPMRARCRECREVK